jgi:rhamnogalacturonan endolyase
VGAWVVLSPDGEGVDDWAMSSKGYQFWTKVGGDGTFSIDKVRAGAYTLWVSGGDHFESFRRAGVTVRAGADTALGVLDRAPAAHGRRVWQVGVADRSVAEFRDGAEPDYRNYDTYKKYFRAFPEDVTFRVGESREAVDWNYAQWSWFNRKPVWTISFPMEAGGAAGKRATLTLGICSASLAGELEVKVNGARVARLAVARTGTASYRSRGQDSPYVVKVVTFDAGMLKAGANEITLGHTGAMPVPADADKAHLRLRAVMYDAVRLEIE